MTVDHERSPAEVFPVGEYLADELEARGWSIADFAEIIDRPTQVVSEIIHGHKSLTADTAQQIASATGTNAATWLALQDAHALWCLERDDKVARRSVEVSLRARMADIVPLRELRLRGIVTGSAVEDQLAQVLELLEVGSLADRPLFEAAARRSNPTEGLNPAQTAWLACVRRASRGIKVGTYDDGALRDLAGSLTGRIIEPEHVLDLPMLLAQAGVALVHVPPFRRGKIDGVAFVEPDKPVIGISARRAGLDAVLFTLLHECAHVVLGHSGVNIDESQGPGGEDRSIMPEIDARELNSREEEANRLAVEWALPSPVDLRPPFSSRSVRAWASAAGVHPAVVVGQLHLRGELPWSHLNSLIPNVRLHVEAWTHTTQDRP